VLTMRMALTGEKYAQTANVERLLRNALERVQSLPGVQSAAATCCVPLEGGYGLPFRIIGRPLEKGPFYAVRVVPGSFGTFAGLATDARARVLDASDTPIPGLYAVGNDQASVMGGHYPAGGINIGPAMTFGYIAAQDLGGS